MNVVAGDIFFKIEFLQKHTGAHHFKGLYTLEVNVLRDFLVNQ